KPWRQVLRDLASRHLGTGPRRLRAAELLLEGQQITAVMLEDVAPSLIVVPGQFLNELSKLIDDGRHDQRGDKRDNERQDCNNDERSRAAIDAPVAHAVHERLKQIGKHETGDKRQKDFVKDQER